MDAKSSASHGAVSCTDGQTWLCGSDWQTPVFTRLFQHEDPPLKATVACEGSEIPLAHSVGPEGRIVGKAKTPDMTAIPAPAVRIRTKSTGPRRTLVSKLTLRKMESEDEHATQIACRQPFSLEEADEFVANSSYVKHAREVQDPEQSDRSPGRHHLLGTCRWQGNWSLTKYCKVRPGMCALLAAIARIRSPEAPFTNVALSVNTSTYPSGQAIGNDDEVQLTWLPLRMPPTGGRIWIEIKPGDTTSGQPTVVEVDGKQVPGQLYSPQDAESFSAKRTGGTQQWDRSQLRLVSFSRPPRVVAAYLCKFVDDFRTCRGRPPSPEQTFAAG